MEVSVCLLFFLLNIFLAAVLVIAQDQSGFISLDFGSPQNTRYREKETNIDYISDASFISTGVRRSIKAEYRSRFQQYLWSLRSFPDGLRNCYSLNVTQGEKYIIKAGFVYGNYDGLNEPPTFDLHLGPNFWTSVAIDNAATAAYPDIIHVSKANHLQVCLVKTGRSTPFISALELRKLPNTLYVNQTGSLQLFIRPDLGSADKQGVRSWLLFPFVDDDLEFSVKCLGQFCFKT